MSLFINLCRSGCYWILIFLLDLNFEQQCPDGFFSGYQNDKRNSTIRKLKIHLTSNSVYYTLHSMNEIFGQYIREKRLLLQKEDRAFSLRQVASRIGIEPSYLSKLERGEQSYLSEEKIIALANELNEDTDVLLALIGKVSKDIQEIIRKRPQLFAQLIRELKNMPDHAVLKIVREVRDGDW